MKRCSRCGNDKPLEEFHKNKRMADGHARYCKACQKLAAHEHYVRHTEEIKARVAEYRARDPEATRERRRQEHIRHAERNRARARKWAADNRERMLANKRRYRRERPDVWRKNNALRRARKKGAAIFGKVDFDAVLARDGLVCWICGKHIDADDLQFDHAVPLSKGGEHSTRNVRVAHQFCNYSKHDRLVTHQMILI